MTFRQAPEFDLDRGGDLPTDGGPLGHVAGDRSPRGASAGRRLPGNCGGGPSEEVRQRVDEEARRIVDECFVEAHSLLTEHRDKVDSLANALLEHETLDEEGIHAAIGLELPPARAPATG